MKWRVDFSKDSLKFLHQNDIEESAILDKIKQVLHKIQGENININVKKLNGEWEGFYRVRFGKLRIIIEFQFKISRIYIEKIDWRGNIYK